MSKHPPIPIYSPIIETHFHLDMLKTISHEDVLTLASKHNIEKLITISTSPENLDKVIELSHKANNLYCSQGVHPHDAISWNDHVRVMIEKNLAKNRNKIVAIGEIGLDYHYTKSPKDFQIAAFKAQLQLAVDFHLPVIIHSRDADEDTQTILENYKNKLLRKGVIHSFTSGIELARFALASGFYLGFNGIITFKNAENVREVLRLANVDRILLETDAPFLTPIPYRGHENAPHYLPFVAEKIAEVKGLPLEQVLKTIYQNSVDLFQFTC
jgi:TatD DNase family protein